MENKTDRIKRNYKYTSSTIHYSIKGHAKSGGKRRLIRREGFASRISKNARPHDLGGGGGGDG